MHVLTLVMFLLTTDRITGERGTSAYLGFQILAGTGLSPRRMAGYVSDVDLDLTAGAIRAGASAQKPADLTARVAADPHTMHHRLSCGNTSATAIPSNWRPRYRGARSRSRRGCPPTSALVGSIDRHGLDFGEARDAAPHHQARALEHPNSLLTAQAAELGDADTTPDNLYMIGTFQLDPDQALVLDIDPPTTRYWNITLENIWHECLEPRHRHSSVTNKGVHPGADGHVRIAISSRDFEVGHWLDTGGRQRGFVVLRWLDNPKPPTSPSRSTRVENDSRRTVFDRSASRRCLRADRLRGLRRRRVAARLAAARRRPHPRGPAFGDRCRDRICRHHSRIVRTAWVSLTGAKSIPKLPLSRSSVPSSSSANLVPGTTILYDLLAQDPQLRPPLTWEVDEPCPVPRPETYHDDPRISQIQSNIDLSEQIIPGFLKFHPMGALVGQECVRITAGGFTSMIYSVQYRLPSYYRWLLYDADHAGAYRYHRIFLQHLQSGVPGQWLLKSPAHLWNLDALLTEYPDALIVQTHRDPLNVISSIAALTHHLRRMSTDESTVAECAAQSYEEVVVGLDREMALRDSGVIPDGRIIDVKFTDFMDDPWATIGGHLPKHWAGSCCPTPRRGCASSWRLIPPDGGRGRYTWSDTNLDAGRGPRASPRLSRALRGSH